jgi:hypothetical protein
LSLESIFGRSKSIDDGYRKWKFRYCRLIDPEWRVRCGECAGGNAVWGCKVGGANWGMVADG